MSAPVDVLAVLRAARDSVPAEQLLDYCAAVAAVSRLIEAAALEAAREDAERYRWLRKGESDDVAVVRGLGSMDYGMSAVVYTYSEEIDGDDLDAAIDAAIAAQQGEGGAA